MDRPKRNTLRFQVILKDRPLAGGRRPWTWATGRLTPPARSFRTASKRAPPAKPRAPFRTSTRPPRPASPPERNMVPNQPHKRIENCTIASTFLVKISQRSKLRTPFRWARRATGCEFITPKCQTFCITVSITLKRQILHLDARRHPELRHVLLGLRAPRRSSHTKCF